ncbi:hypothetical protein F5X68DRAFT_243450 [Plectosphaerella plurivora]|uniref:NmrA-like domain-containing protein n=1 Tax=Plectosphaerella plurivora TaxID=936078 RepID=A0A9P8VLS3_9PEZI|nr:hypothetical protein F5X68DRAFT_243450 [Plectosphaerella plurivora]
MSFNRIAIHGHRGLFSSTITAALIASGAPVTILYRPGSETSNIPAGTRTIEVDPNDEDALVAALQDIDIVISLVGVKGVPNEFGFVKAIPRTEVKLFVPSDLGLRYGEEGMKIPLLRMKEDVQEGARRAGIPVMGIDVKGNRLCYTGNAAKEKVGMCTADYVAAAYVSLFTKSPISEVSNRAIGLVELAPTGEEVAAALEKKHGKPPAIFHQPVEDTVATFNEYLNAESDAKYLAPAWFYRKIWGTGEITTMLGQDIYHVPDYQKATLEELVVEGKVKPYRDLSKYNDFWEMMYR